MRRRTPIRRIHRFARYAGRRIATAPIRHGYVGRRRIYTSYRGYRRAHPASALIACLVFVVIFMFVIPRMSGSTSTYYMGYIIGFIVLAMVPVIIITIVRTVNMRKQMQAEPVQPIGGETAPVQPVQQAPQPAAVQPKFCKYCGAELQGNEIFCGNCGANLSN
ncbi:MAG: zinc-ribbon domain-containing protein [Candidatus Hodarchaeota archaeon]